MKRTAAVFAIVFFAVFFTACDNPFSRDLSNQPVQTAVNKNIDNTFYDMGEYITLQGYFQLGMSIKIDSFKVLTDLDELESDYFVDVENDELKADEVMLLYEAEIIQKADETVLYYDLRYPLMFVVDVTQDGMMAEDIDDYVLTDDFNYTTYVPVEGQEHATNYMNFDAMTNTPLHATFGVVLNISEIKQVFDSGNRLALMVERVAENDMVRSESVMIPSEIFSDVL